MHNKKSILGEQWFMDCGGKHLYSNVSESNKKKKSLVCYYQSAVHL